MITSKNIKCKSTVNVCVNVFYFNVKVLLLLIFNLNKTPLGETGCLSSPYFLLTGCLGIQFFNSPS